MAWGTFPKEPFVDVSPTGCSLRIWLCSPVHEHLDGLVVHEMSLGKPEMVQAPRWADGDGRRALLKVIQRVYDGIRTQTQASYYHHPALYYQRE